MRGVDRGVGFFGNLLVKKISLNAVKSAHSYDADKETIKRMKA